MCVLYGYSQDQTKIPFISDPFTKTMFLLLSAKETVNRQSDVVGMTPSSVIFFISPECMQHNCFW